MTITHAWCARHHYARATGHATRGTRITPAIYAAVPHGAPPLRGPVAVGRNVPIAPPRRIARGGSPPRCAAWHRAHAESFACRGSVRGTVRGRVAHPARCRDRAAITPAHYLWAHYPRPRGTRITRAARWSAATARGGSPPSRLAPYRHYTRSSRARITPPVRTRPCARCRAPWCGPVAVGRDVPIAPPRRIARGGSPPRCVAWRCAIFAITHAKFARPRGDAHYPGGAMRTSRPTAITHA